MSIVVRKLLRSFYDRPTLEVCEELIGQIIVYNSPTGRLSAKTTEVEAYIGQDDPACHASRGMTERNKIMFGQPGMAYIYFIYGMYNCLNFVTEADGLAAAILLRGAEPIDGLEFMRQQSKTKKEKKEKENIHDWQLLNGPGKFCRSFGLTREQNGLDLTGDELYLEHSKDSRPLIKRSPRIGISVGQEKMWRFYDVESKAVSKPPKVRTKTKVK